MIKDKTLANSSKNTYFQVNNKFMEFEVNQEETKRLQASKEFRQYIQWLLAQGVLIDSAIRFPTYFGTIQEGFVGVSAIKNIESQKALICVPYKLLITTDKIRNHQILRKIIFENLHIFRNEDESVFRTLILFVSFELLKKENSFYYPYFQICNLCKPVNWTNKDFCAIEQKQVILAMKNQKEEMELQFMRFLKIYRIYDQIFPEKLTNQDFRDLYQKAYNMIMTRAFGWSLPSISLIPLADSFNHGNVRYVDHFLVNINLQNHNESHSYVQRQQKINLQLFNKSTLNTSFVKATVPSRKASKKQSFINKHAEILRSSSDLTGKPFKEAQFKSKEEIGKDHLHVLFQQYKSQVHSLGELHFYESSSDQDNDTDEEDLFQFNYQKQQFLLGQESSFKPQSSLQSQVYKFWKIYTENEEDFQEDQDPNQPQNQHKSNQAISQTQKEPSRKAENGRKSNESSEIQSEEEEEGDEDYSWVSGKEESSYFVMSSMERVKEGEQIYNFYGRRCNKFLLVGYNFTLQNNIYDSYPLRLFLSMPLAKEGKPFNPSKLLSHSHQTHPKSKIFKLKRNKLNLDLLSISRSYCLLQCPQPHYWITCPFDLQFEGKVLTFYQDLIVFLLKQFSTSLEEDRHLLSETQGAQRLAIQMRVQYKIILQNQIYLISKAMDMVCRWKSGAIKNLEEKEFHLLPSLREYLISFQKSGI